MGDVQQNILACKLQPLTILIGLLIFANFFGCSSNPDSPPNKANGFSEQLLGKWYLSAENDCGAVWRIPSGDTMNQNRKFLNNGILEIRYPEYKVNAEGGMKFFNFIKFGNWEITPDSFLKITAIQYKGDPFKYDEPPMKIVKFTKTNLILQDLNKNDEVEHWINPTQSR